MSFFKNVSEKRRRIKANQYRCDLENGGKSHKYLPTRCVLDGCFSKMFWFLRKYKKIEEVIYMVFYGFLVLFIACFFQGSFGLGMKNYKPFSWEAFWTLFSIVGILIIPLTWTWIEVPNFMTYIAETPTNVCIIASVCGFIWGISAIWFGKAIDTIGMSLTYGVNMGVSASLGSLIPLFILGKLPKENVLVLLLIGTIVMLVGVGVITKAGLLKDKESKLNESQTKNEKFMGGMILALLSGLGSAAINIGFTYAGETSQIAISHGVNSVSASLISWVIVLSGGFISNFLYAVTILIKNRTYTNYVAEGSGIAYFKVLITSAIWFAALGFYAKATALLGSLGPVVGWIAFNAVALIISNVWGLKTGEWQGFQKPKKILLYGNFILIISWIIVGVANGLNV